MDRLTEKENLAMWLKLYHQKGYCMSDVTSSQRYQAPEQPPQGYTSKTAL